MKVIVLINLNVSGVCIIKVSIYFDVLYELFFIKYDL